jgi:RNA polymerase primary sigma factor
LEAPVFNNIGVLSSKKFLLGGKMKVRTEKQNKVGNVSWTDDFEAVYFRDIGRYKLLTAEQEVELAKEIAAGKKDAKEKMTQANLYLVTSVAKDHQNRGLDFADLVAEGSFGLMRAVEKFDYRKGNRFSTCATWWIRQSMGKAIGEKSRNIRLPSHVTERINKMNRAKWALNQNLWRNPTDEEIAKHLGWTVVQVRALKARSQDSLSLEEQIGSDEDGDLSLLDSTEDKNAVNQADEAVCAMLREELHAVLSTLPAMEARVVRMRYGLNGGCPLTLQETGKRLGISRERVRQVELSGMRHLREPKRCQRLRAYL